MFYRSNRCCESRVNLLLFPLVSPARLIVTQATPPGWYALYPPSSPRTQSALCYIPAAPAINPYLGWATYPIESCDSPDSKNDGGLLRCLSLFVDDFTETAAAETGQVNISDNLIVASGRHVNPRFYKDSDYIVREMHCILNPGNAVLDPLTQAFKFTPTSIAHCRTGTALIRDQTVSHVGHDQIFGTFVNCLLRITGNYQGARQQAELENTPDLMYAADLLKLTLNTATGSLLIKPSSAWHKCCDCPNETIRIFLDGVVVNSTGTGVTDVRDTPTGTYITIDPSAGIVYLLNVTVPTLANFRPTVHGNVILNQVII